MKYFVVFAVFLSFGCNQPKNMQPSRQDASSSAHESNKRLLPIGGNAWVTSTDTISNEGLFHWNNPQSVCKAYCRLDQVGKLKISLFWDADEGESTIKVSILGKSIELQVEGCPEKEYYVGEWAIEKPGYVAIEIQGVKKSGPTFGNLSNIGISGSARSPGITFVQNNQDNYFYWGRRGPSVHLNYATNGLDSIEWFYSEITVPKGNDVIGSYFMANGFAEGYFGFQVNSSTERHVLFSVWSPFETDDPSTIPDDHKIIAVKKGTGVHLGEFGNEGSGGQSYLDFPWKAGNTYRFLLHGRPAGNNSSEFTAYFFAPETNEWRLIASFQRPQTSTYLTKLHSFLENFEPETGNIQRMAMYSNQWVKGADGAWTELTGTRFTGDQTARKNFRKDYAGGVKNEQFYLKNCGFFDDYVPMDQSYTRPMQGKSPMIDFSKL